MIETFTDTPIRLKFSRNWRSETVTEPRLQSQLERYPQLVTKKVDARNVTIPPKLIVDIIDEEEFTFAEATKVFQTLYWYLYGANAAERMRKDFGDRVESELGIDLNNLAMRGLRTQYLDDEVLRENLSVVLNKLQA